MHPAYALRQMPTVCCKTCRRSSWTFQAQKSRKQWPIWKTEYSGKPSMMPMRKRKRRSRKRNERSGYHCRRRALAGKVVDGERSDLLVRLGAKKRTRTGRRQAGRDSLREPIQQRPLTTDCGGAADSFHSEESTSRGSYAERDWFGFCMHRLDRPRTIPRPIPAARRSRR